MKFWGIVDIWSLKMEPEALIIETLELWKGCLGSGKTFRQLSLCQLPVTNGLISASTTISSTRHPNTTSKSLLSHLVSLLLYILPLLYP